MDVLISDKGLQQLLLVTILTSLQNYLMINVKVGIFPLLFGLQDSSVCSYSQNYSMTGKIKTNYMFDDDGNWIVILAGNNISGGDGSGRHLSCTPKD